MSVIVAILVICIVRTLAQEIPSFLFEQTLDHFNFQDNRTFQQRYYVYDGFWDGHGPILFYLGAESPTEAMALNSTSLVKMAPALNGLLVAVEHRFYGQSMPFSDPSPVQLGYLAVEQALEDFITILVSVQDEYNATEVPVFSIGGSYGGLLASAIRIRYPNNIWGAYATGAPVNIADPALFFNATSYAYLIEDKLAAATIKEGFDGLVKMIQNQDGREQIQALFGLCDPLNTIEDGWSFLFWAQWGFVGPAEFNYNLPGLYTVPLPLKHMCELINAANDSISAVASAVSYSWNFTGIYTNPPCFPTINIYHSAGGTGVGLKEFLYQMCTQVYIPSASNGVTDLFYQTNITLIKENFDNMCMNDYGISGPDLTYFRDNFYGDGKFKSITNIVFTNGWYDPVRGLGLLDSLSDSIVSLHALMAHTQDFLLPMPDEDPSVAILRGEVIKYLQTWTNQFYMLKNK